MPGRPQAQRAKRLDGRLAASYLSMEPDWEPTLPAAGPD